MCVASHLAALGIRRNIPWGWKWMEHESSFNKSNKSIFILQLLKFDLRADLQPTNQKKKKKHVIIMYNYNYNVTFYE